MYTTKILWKEFETYQEALDFVNKVKKWKPCNTRWESPCKHCLKWDCSSLMDENMYEIIGITPIFDRKYLLTYVK